MSMNAKHRHFPSREKNRSFDFEAPIAPCGLNIYSPLYNNSTHKYNNSHKHVVVTHISNACAQWSAVSPNYAYISAREGRRRYCRYAYNKS